MYVLTDRNCPLIRRESHLDDAAVTEKGTLLVQAAKMVEEKRRVFWTAEDRILIVLDVSIQLCVEKVLRRVPPNHPNISDWVDPEFYARSFSTIS